MGPERPQAWKNITLDQIISLELKAEGTGALVYHGYLPSNVPDEKPIAVAVRKPRITSAAALNRVEDELRIRSTLSHPNLLPLLAACDKPPDYCTVSPWMSGGTLFDLIHTNSVYMTFERLLQLSLQLARVMEYLHSKNLVHRDLKTANILLDANWENLVLADLDLVTDVNELHTAATTNSGRASHRGPSNGRLSHMVGTLVYMAPEVLKGAPHSLAADVYAFAITINEMAAFAVPFVDRKMPVPELHTVLETRFNEVRLRGAIVKDHLRPILATGVPLEFNALIERCWHPDPSARPSFKQIVEILDNILQHGEDYLHQYTGSTLPSASDDNKDVSSNIQTMLDEMVNTPTRPPVSIWEKQRSKNPNFKLVPSARDLIKPLNVVAALSSTSGERGEDSMEDRSIIAQNLAGLSNTHLFGIFDGHSGQMCSEFAVQHLEGAMLRIWGNEEATPESVLIHAFEDLDHVFLNSTPENEQSGCTALAALIIDSILYVANAGDCRCVLGKTDGTALDLSKDHVATDPVERARISARGGFVTVTGRAQGCLMVSRAFGDRAVKRYISATPDVETHPLSDEDDFIILASDGLWDVVSSKDAVSMVQSTVRVPDLAAKRLALKALELGSDDNISVIVAFLRGTVSFSSL